MEVDFQHIADRLYLAETWGKYVVNLEDTFSKQLSFAATTTTNDSNYTEKYFHKMEICFHYQKFGFYLTENCFK